MLYMMARAEPHGLARFNASNYPVHFAVLVAAGAVALGGLSIFCRRGGGFLAYLTQDLNLIQ
jgi:hypothetical protein